MSIARLRRRSIYPALAALLLSGLANATPSHTQLHVTHASDSVWKPETLTLFVAGLMSVALVRRGKRH